MNKSISREEYLDICVLSEPLACVMHSYRKMPFTLNIAEITIFGAGPIGTLHALYAHKLFPLANIKIVEPDIVRKKLVENLLPFASVFDDIGSSLTKSNLVVVATSSIEAQINAINNVDSFGIVILFSGINHKNKNELPYYENHDLESIHRNEEVRVISDNRRLVGSSGYHPLEIDLSINELLSDYTYYKIVQTAIVSGLDNNIIDNVAFNEPVITKLLVDGEKSQNYLKILFRHDSFPSKESRVVFKDGKPEIEYFDNLTPNDDEVLVRILRSSICQTDRRVLLGLKSNEMKNGLILGHEGIGIVVATGENINKEFIGKTCTIMPHYFSNKEDKCVKIGTGYLSPFMKHLGIHVNGCFATLATFPVCCIRLHSN